MRAQGLRLARLAVRVLLLLAPARVHAQEPVQAFAAQMAARIARHPYLARTTLERVESHPPYLFYVQPSPAGTAAVLERLVPLLEPLRARFEREVAAPLGLVQRADTPALVVVVLSSRAAYDECYRATPGAWHYDAQASFDRDVAAAIVYDDPAAGRAPAEVQHSARHALVHVLQRAFGPGERPVAVRGWLFEGMADFLAREPAGDAFPAPERLAEFVQDAATPLTRWAHLRTLEELCTVDEPLELARFFQERTRDPALLPGPDRDPWTAFYREATLLYAFFQQRDELRAGLLRFAARAFAGSHGPDVLAASLAPRTLAAAEQDFAAWILAQHARAFPAEKVKQELVLGALLRDDLFAPALAPGPAAPPLVGTGTPAPAPDARPLPPLSLADANEEERFALALADIGAGRIRAGRARLAELAGAAEGAWRARLEREDRRAAEFEAARDAFLARLVAEQGLLELDLGPRVTARKFALRACSEGLVELDDKKGGLRRVPVEALDPLALARQMGGTPGEPERVRFYLYVLRGDERWRKLLKPDGGEASALLEDARADYPPRLHLAAQLVEVLALSQAGPAATPKEIDQRVERFRAVLHDGADTAFVQRKRETLRAHAAALLARKFELLGPGAVLHGKLEALGGTRVRITYPFDDPRELEDFGVEPYPLLASRGLKGEQSDDQPFHVEKGRLHALGTATLRSLWDLAAPLVVRYDLAFDERELDAPAFYFTLGVCDDGREHFLWAVNLDTLQRLDPEGGDSTPEHPSSLYLDRSYALELRHDGQRVTLSCEGAEQGSLAAGARTSGALFLHAVTDLPVRVQKLVIEGELRADGFARLAQAWAARQMAGW